VSKPEFLADIRSARVELEGMLARLDEHTLAEARVPEMDWTAKDVLSHLIGYDLAILTAIADIRAGRAFAWGWTYPNFDPWNESTVGPRRASTYAAVRAELDLSQTRLLEELARWPEDVGPFGPQTWDRKKSEIGWVGPHEREHAEMIAKLSRARGAPRRGTP
jgi:hypothetical protein